MSLKYELCVQGSTALHIAARKGSVQIAMLLVQASPSSSSLLSSLELSDTQVYEP